MIEQAPPEPTWILKVRTDDLLVPEYARGERAMFGNNPPTEKDREEISQEMYPLNSGGRLGNIYS